MWLTLHFFLQIGNDTRIVEIRSEVVLLVLRDAKIIKCYF